MPALIRFSWIWLGAVFALLSLTVNKQTQYALLFAPPTAILIGHYLAVAEGGFLRLNRLLFGLFCLLTLVGIALAVRKSGFEPQPLAWLLLPLLPLVPALVFQRAGRSDAISLPVLTVAALTSMVFLFGEANLSKEPHKLAAQSVMVEAAKHERLVQVGAPPGNGALSFYAGRVVRAVTEHQLPTLVAEHGEVWAVVEGGDGAVSLSMHIPALAVEMVTKVDDLSLYRLSRRER